MRARTAALAAVAAACLLAATATIAGVSHLPLLDQPIHRLMARVIVHYDDPALEYCRYYERDLRFRPYLGYYAVAWLLSPVVDAEGAARACLVGAFWLTPLGVLAYTRAVAPERAAAALLSIPALYTSHYYLGFINFVMALGPSLLALAAIVHFGRRPTAVAAVSFLAASTVSYLCHAMAFAIAMGYAACHAALAPRKMPALLLVAATIAAAASVTEPGAVLPQAHDLHYRPFGSALAPPGPERGIVFASPLFHVQAILHHVAIDATGIDLALWLCLPLALTIATRRDRASSSSSPLLPRALVPLLSLVLLFVTPSWIGNVGFISMKHIAFLFLALPPLVPLRWLQGRGLHVLALMALAASAVFMSTHLRFDREARAIDDLLPLIRPGARVVPLFASHRSRALLWIRPYEHFSHVVQAERGGAGEELHPGPQQPVRMRPEGETSYHALYHYRPWLIASLPPPVMADYLLLRGAELEAFVPPEYHPLAESGAFRLFGRAAAP